MKLNAPKYVTWLIAVILGVIGLICYIVAVAMGSPPAWLSHVAFWCELLAALILAAATAFAKI